MSLEAMLSRTPSVPDENGVLAVPGCLATGPTTTAGKAVDWYKPWSNPTVVSHTGIDLAPYLERLISQPDPCIEGLKASNPKDSVGVSKPPMSTVSAVVMAEVGVAMLEGACKYGRHNYRSVGVMSSVYYDATHRHLTAWWEGQDDDPDSGLSHITKAIASLTVLRDAMIFDKLKDDRPPKAPEGFFLKLSEKAKAIKAKYKDLHPAHITEKGM